MTDVMESEKSTQRKIPHWRQVTDPGAVTPEIINYPYSGSGTEEDPYLVQWIPNDPRNPMNYSAVKKWSITFVVAIATLAVAMISSAYTGGAIKIAREFRADAEVITLGVSLFVLGFAIGPLIWAPMSELFGRQVLFFGTYLALTAFNAGAAGSPNIQTLLVLRFFAGSFGSSPLTNAGGVIADMFPASHRGLAMGLFAIAPFLGPVLGPVIGGFLGESAGWRWVEGLLAIFSGTVWIIGSIFLPETYPPVLLRKRAQRLSKLTGKVYASRMDIEQGKLSIGQAFQTALMRPWILLFCEPIVFLLSIYMAIVYGTLYMLFSAFPVVYQQYRGWTPGIGGLAFLGVLGGILIAMVVNLLDSRRYAKVSQEYKGFAPPEERLPVAIIGGIAIPIGLFWFAWTNGPQIHWIVSIIASAPFGFGMVLVFLSLMNYLIDAYTIYAASVLAANSVLRSLFGAAFPLFTRYMYQNLGIHWASTIPAFLALACVPFPFLFYKYGADIRKRCKFAGEADAFMQKIIQANSAQLESDLEISETDPTSRRSSLELGRAGDTLARIQSARSGLTRTHTAATIEYEGNPYDIDRVNTRLSRVSTTKSRGH
ncbi:MFS siderochrome iron transporter 1 [Microsporum canis]|uniref:Polyamine transporter 3 n=1 Tax=Arthroderma otae (strain ATCC MYA-4605 / CBS 113480) TaxID=554155 RepID=C5FK08_ARTOC|nr:polyamine transporter 3 [Microsporum canis CBS 113480]EEQ30030.1 polyamine transporter 3 [Microsporum canis CBS 113480]